MISVNKDTIIDHGILRGTLHIHEADNLIIHHTHSSVFNPPAGYSGDHNYNLQGDIFPITRTRSFIKDILWRDMSLTAGNGIHKY